MGNSKKPRKSWLSKRRGARIQNERVVNPERRNVTIPDEEKTLLKTVDAMVNGQRIGDALMYDDGSVDIKIDDNADPDLVAAVQGEINDFNVEHGTEFTQDDLFVSKED